jgi:hypothetical protein
MIAKDQDFRAQMDVFDAFDRRVIITVLETDTLFEISRKVWSAGGEAVVVVCDSEGGTARMRPVRFSEANEHADGDFHVPVREQCTIQQLLAVLLPGSSITVRFDGDELKLDDLTDVTPDDLVSAE